MPGSQDFASDPRNERVHVYLNGRMVPRAEATVSIFDAGFVLGDGIWEGIRLHKGALLFEKAHLDRLFEGARAIQLAQRVPQQYANSDFAYRAQRLMYLLQQKIPTYGNVTD